MTADEYKATRQRFGTQAEVAARLGVARSTVADRERGDMVITTEAALALSALAGAGRKKPWAKKGKKKNSQAEPHAGLGGQS
jgi:transcriptional regulator with XRE-family HTH domain